MILYGLPPLYQSPPVDEYGQPVPVPGPVPMAPTMAANGPMSPAGGIPAPMTPSMALPPPPGYMGRFGDALRMAPAFHGAPGMSAGQGFAGGLMAGLSGGLQANAAGSEKQAAMQAQAVNTKNKTMADFNNQLVMKTYENALAEQLRKRVKEDGMITIAPDDVTKFWLPSSMPVGSKVAPAALAPYAMAMNKPQQEALVPIPNEPALAKYMGGNPGDLVKRSDILSARTGMKPSGAMAGNGAFGAEFNPAAIAGAIKRREVPADPSGYSRGQWGMIASEFVKQFPGENLSDLTANWKSFNRNINTMQGTAFVKMGTNIEGVTNSLELARQSLASLQKTAPAFTNTPMNKLAQQVQQNYNFGGPAQQAAVSDFISKTETARLQYASMLAGGGAPTEQDLKHADQIIDYRKPAAAFNAQVDAAQADVGVRRQAYENAAQLKGINPYGNSARGAGGDRVRIIRNGVPGTILRTDVLPSDKVVQ